MANVANLEKKLLKLINNKDSFAIALTGEWGIFDWTSTQVKMMR